MRFLYGALPVLIVCAVLRLLLAERLDFSAVLLGITVLTGAVWALDALWLAPRRAAAARRAGKDPAGFSEPGTVDYARSFFPVALVVLLLRSFVFEPFRIPSDSMMPTLLDGDFIIVNKYTYGLRLPVLNRKIVAMGEPQRGDVVVFRYPPDPSVNFIKRLVGLPGDHVEVHDNLIIVNGKPVPFYVGAQRYNDGCYVNMSLARERLGNHEHEAIFCPVALDRSPVLPGCKRSGVRGYVCGDEDAPGGDARCAVCRRRAAGALSDDGRQPRQQRRRAHVGLGPGREPRRQGDADLVQLGSGPRRRPDLEPHWQGHSVTRVRSCNDA